MPTAKEMTQMVVQWAEDRKAENIRVFDLLGKTSYTDYVIVCEGNSGLHLRAIADYIISKAREVKYATMGNEGLDNGQWVLIDLFDIIVHVFLPSIRENFKIDQLFESLEQKPKQEETTNDKI
ncbi:MAG TPA: ribosome silencing factor [Candidatus Cloacimonadota bacterium]|nr:ribosome silencing factor [Candidatus Cloacimonadota bacterium]HPT71515.1 ribosome silencing factor [Candidatus Cloacimonadota bacterium]